MQISRPIVSHPLLSASDAVPYTPHPTAQWFLRVRRAVSWMFDIDDGGGAITCFVCVLAVFGTLVFRLVELDHSLDSQMLKCTAVDKNTLQMQCEFK
jgi:hypothetical protein